VQGEDWAEHCRTFGLSFEKIPAEKFIWKILWKVWKVLNLPLRLWRSQIAPKHPLGKLFEQDPKRLWLFPSQDILVAKFNVHGVVSIHDLMHIYEPSFPEVGSWMERRRRNWNYQKICCYAEVILVDSHLGKNQILENFQCRPEKIKVLPYTVPFYIRNHGENLPTCSVPKPFYFYPAQLWKHKNHLRLIEAFGRICMVDKNVSLVLVGAPENASHEVQQLIAEKGLHSRIVQLGYVENQQMVTLYREALALVFPSFFGPTNIPPLEALALGCPVLCSDIYAMRGQLKDQATYFDPRSVDSIFDAMRSVLARKPSQPVLLKDLQMDAFVEKLQAILFEVCNPRES
jgi:glycosyltransferase involved in cell wall biosynthesis